MDQEQFTAYLAGQGLADNTIRAYRALYQRWLDWAIANGRDPQHPDPIAIRAWASQVHGSREMIAQARATIGHACRALELDDTSAAIPLPRAPRRGPRPLDRDVAAQLARHALASGLAGTAVIVGLTTAMRRSEIAELRWDGCDFTARTVTFWRPKVRDWHTIAMHSFLAEHLEPRATGETWVFPGRHGGHVAPAVIWEWVKQVADEAGVGHITPHRLRHTALTEAYDSTGDLRAVQDLAGHTNPSITAAYTRTSAQRGRAAVDAIRLFGDPDAMPPESPAA